MSDNSPSTSFSTLTNTAKNTTQASDQPNIAELQSVLEYFQVPAILLDTDYQVLAANPLINNSMAVTLLRRITLTTSLISLWY